MSITQSGVVTVGNQNGTTFSKEVTITFPQPFPTTPVVVANTLQQPNLPPIPDAFAVSIIEVNTKTAVARVYRVDIGPQPPGGWAQNLQLAWIAHS
ncbi:hypothetical protein [Okeania sp. SIO2B3]|uniref:hypothetical protein n=1 Tax=Okeania sp. SIO2B3 TaxID=2607784 RepID=UPI0013C09004|nr:hypothetical protein [Okeania sp. SIO2B3]NET41016.1 hypothetical protein [Okeania sp. SIO2B3]